MTDQMSRNQAIIACNPNAVPADVREQWVETGKQVYAAVQEVQDLPDGYGFRLPVDSAMLLKVATYIANERLCCAFLHFTVDVGSNGGPFWLRLTGDEGVKEYIRSMFAMHDLLNEQVVNTAGLR
ncbi:MAG: hypothetical protein JO011_17645 [Ktedonobacteraceae bacterium]|nr:hypothetical protein [Ktedonobacteraceae bacterium]MBV9712730.1 hypothetical protein [Ktedonobacteraceae bacterium]